jgi:hypothetical protein
MPVAGKLAGQCHLNRGDDIMLLIINGLFLIYRQVSQYGMENCPGP